MSYRAVHHNPRRIRLAWLGAILSCVCSASLAHAHGRFPAATGLAFEPGAPDQVWVRTTFGFLRRSPTGDGWRWTCPDVAGASEREDPTFVALPGGGLVVGHSLGLARSADGCAWWAPEAALQGEYVVGLVRDPRRAERLLAVTASRETERGVYISEDAGRTWSLRATPFGEMFPRTLHVAPSSPDTLYVSAARPSRAAGQGPESALFRSEDGGATWQMLPFALEDGAFELQVLAVSPVDPRRVFARALRQTDEPLLLSEDGGVRFQVVTHVRAPIRALTFSEDGQRVWVGGDLAGLWQSDDAGRNFRQVEARVRVQCLHYEAGALYLCDSGILSGYQVGRAQVEDAAGGRGEDGSSGVGNSEDEYVGGQADARFDVWLRLADVVELADCPADSDAVRECGPRLQAELDELALFRDLPAPGRDAGHDGGPQPVETAVRTTRCSVGAPGVDAGRERETASVGGVRNAVFVGVIVAWLMMRRRRRARRRVSLDLT